MSPLAVRAAGAWAATLLLASACLVGGPQPAPDASLAARLQDPTTVPPVGNGPILRMGGGVVDGTQVEAAAADSANGELCIYQVTEAGVEGATCGRARGAPGVFGSFSVAEVLGGSAIMISSFLGSEVERVEVVMLDGPREASAVRLDELAAGLRGFAVVLPRDIRGASVRALDAEGEVLDQVVDLLPMPPG